jgi:hypothetical protein
MDGAKDNFHGVLVTISRDVCTLYSLMNRMQSQLAGII